MYQGHINPTPVVKGKVSCLMDTTQRSTTQRTRVSLNRPGSHDISRCWEFRADWAIPQPKSLNPLPFIEPPCCTGGGTGANLEAAVIDGFVLSGPERYQAPTSVGASLGIGLLRSIQNGAYPPWVRLVIAPK